MLSLESFQEKRPRLLNLLIEIASIESPTADKAQVDKLGVRIQQELRRLGAEITVVPQSETGDHIVGRWQGAAGKPRILTLCHMDTVHPVGTLAQFPLREEDGKLWGPGTIDMKAGIADLLVAIETMQEQGEWPACTLTTLFNSDEETGSTTSRKLIEELARQSDLVLCLEPCLPDGSLKIWRKGVGDFKITVHGREAHAGGSHKHGINAIEELAHQVITIQKMTDYDKGTTLNVGVIGGGTVSNVVPAEAWAEIDLRVTDPKEAERITAAMQALKPVLPGTTIEVTGGLGKPPMPENDMMRATFAKAKEIGKRLGLELTSGGTGGGSDANTCAALGIPVLDGMGARGNGLHSYREHVVIDSMPERSAMLAAIFTEWS